MSARRRPAVAVVGGGIAGLAAAWELVTSDEGPAPEVLLLEAGARWGGSLRSAEFAGRVVDVAADAFLARRPEATELCTELGLAGQLVPVGATGASVWARGRLRPLPPGLNLGVPTRWWPLARSGILSPAEVLRVARDLVQPHLRVGGISSDRAVGAIVEARLGRPVVDRLVDPLVGGINAGDVNDLSAAATFPYLLAASLQPGSLMRRLGRQLQTPEASTSEPNTPEPNTPEPTARAGRPPVFWSLPGGTTSLADHLSAELGRRGVDRRTGVAVEAIRRSGPGHPGRWQLDVRADRDFTLDVDGVVLAVPAREAGVLLATHAPGAAGLLSTIEYASVAVVTLVLPKGTFGAPLHGTGLLVPRTGTIDGAAPLMTAATYLGRKWPHLAREGDELIRVSVGRFGDVRHEALDDDELCRSVMAELAHVLDGHDRPIESMVTRWARALPQYRVGHLLRVARVEQEIGALGGMAVAGAAYRGVGIPACIGGGRDAAQPRPRVPLLTDRLRPVPGGRGRAPVTSGSPPSTSDHPAPSGGPTRPAWRPSRVSMTRRGTAVRPRPGGVAVPALASGAGLALSLPPWGAWALAFPAAGLLFWRLRGLRPRTRLWAGWLAGLGCYGPGLMWARAFTIPGALVLIAVEAGFVAGACLVVPAAPVAARVLAFPGAMTLAEWARMHWPFGGLPIGGVFLGQAGGPALGVARLGGPLALTAAVYVGGVGVGSLAEVAVRAGRDGWRSRAFARADATSGDRSVTPGVLGGAVAGLGGTAVAGAIAVALVVGISIAADHAPDGGAAIGTVTTAAVQGGGARGFSKSQIDPAVVLAAQFSATRLVLHQDRGITPQLVLWPEDVVSLNTSLAGSPEESDLAGLARTLHTTLVVGVTETISQRTFRNEVVAFGPDGTLVSRYEKVHRVPFGEYVPFRGFFSHLADLSAVPLDAVPGTGSGLLPTPAGPLGAMVSYEVFYADRGRSSVRHGAQLLIVPTNTSSYATAQVPTQEIAASEVQAVQQGRDLLQAAPTGYSAAITNRGTLLQRSVLGARQVITATLARRTGSTVYVRYGDQPVLLFAAAALLVGWLVAGRHRYSR